MIKKDLFKFIVPSLLGIMLFIFPISYNGDVTIAIAVLSKIVLNVISSISNSLIMGVVVVSSLITLFTSIFKPKIVMDSRYLRTLFNPSWFWVVVRLIASVYIFMIIFQIGPEVIWSSSTGGVVLESLLPILLSVFVLAGLFLPLLLNFGLLEFVGVLLTKVMRPIFKLPGRSSIDCVASWLGDGTIGILLTSKQFEQGYYTEKEAAIIGTTFSAVSITFSLVVIEAVGLGDMFVPFYLTISFVGLVNAIITPRIPPLSRKKNIYYQGHKAHDTEIVPSSHNLFTWGVEQAIARSKQNNSIGLFFKEGVQNVVDLWFGIVPVVLTIGTSALILAEHTPIFRWLGIPLVPLLEFLQLPEAEAASQTMFVGFTDMFIPSIMAAATITAPITKFVVAALSVTQLIYMAEVGGLLLGSKIPVSFMNLVVIFLQRTIISLPIIALIAHMLF